MVSQSLTVVTAGFLSNGGSLAERFNQVIQAVAKMVSFSGVTPTEGHSGLTPINEVIGAVSCCSTDRDAIAQHSIS